MSEEQPGGILPRLPPALAERMTQVFRRVAGLDPQLNIRDVIDQVGVDYDAALRLWRAFGMPIVDPHQGSSTSKTFSR